MIPVHNAATVIEKAVGVSPVNRGNPFGQGGKAKHEEIEKYRAEIVKDYVSAPS